jgi:hypothetical protein
MENYSFYSAPEVPLPAYGNHDITVVSQYPYMSALRG